MIALRQGCCAAQTTWPRREDDSMLDIIPIILDDSIGAVLLAWQIRPISRFTRGNHAGSAIGGKESKISRELVSLVALRSKEVSATPDKAVVNKTLFPLLAPCSRI